MDVIRVLLVDDEREFVDLLSKRLKSRGFDTACAYTGEEALAAIGNQEFDVIVMDVKMPGIDGIEALRAIKEIQPSIEIIMLTGHATIDTAVEGMKYDAFDYLVKPIEIESLMQKLKEAFNKRYHNDGAGAWRRVES